MPAPMIKPNPRKRPSRKPMDGSTGDKRTAAQAMVELRTLPDKLKEIW